MSIESYLFVQNRFYYLSYIFLYNKNGVPLNKRSTKLRYCYVFDATFQFPRSELFTCMNTSRYAARAFDLTSRFKVHAMERQSLHFGMVWPPLFMVL